jgi:hypothetical protein
MQDNKNLPREITLHLQNIISSLNAIIQWEVKGELNKLNESQKKYFIKQVADINQHLNEVYLLFTQG